MITDKEFIKKLIDRFPDLKDILLDEDWMGYITLQLGALPEFMENLAKTNKKKECLDIIRFIEANFEKLDPTVKNAVCVSFLEHLNPEMTLLIDNSVPVLQQELRDLTEYNKRVSEDQRIKDFFNTLK